MEKRGRPRAGEQEKKRKLVLERHNKILEMAKRHARTREFLEDPELGPFFLGRGPQAMKMLRSVYEVPDPYAYRKPLVLYIYGDTEINKSREARRWLKEVCRLPPNDVWIWMPSELWKWHNKYERHKAIILDDFIGGMPMGKLRNVLDGYEIPCEEKNGDVVHCPYIIIITSDRPYDQLELKGKDKEGKVIPMKDNEKAQIRRRITHIYHFKRNHLGNDENGRPIFRNVIPLERPEVLEGHDELPSAPVPASPPSVPLTPSGDLDQLDQLLGSPAEIADGDLGALRRLGGISGEGWEELQLDRAGEGLDGEGWEDGEWD